jgi:2-dehydro-3-deoxyphosphogluconate aldolase/(4S)-4-hydroxy-2-oxoglutarate aldolase
MTAAQTKLSKKIVRAKVLEVGIVPVVRAATPELALTACRAIAAGGIPIVEVTLTVPGAVEVITELTRTMSADILIGAGTVLDQAAAQRCLDAGAQFLVSPGFDRETVSLAGEAGVLIMAGGLTPTEVITAWKAGSDFVKVFPCGNVGGPAYIKSLKAALPQIPMVPTGGVNISTAAAFLDAGASALGVGSELVRGSAEEITALARAYAAVIQDHRK